MKDIFGNELEVGDTVAFNEPDYHNMITGEVLKFTPKMIHIRYTASQHRNPQTTYEYPLNVVKQIGVDHAS